MNSEKAFTMIELLGIIAVLGILILMTAPNLTSSLNKNDQKAYDEFINNLLIASETYIQNNRDSFPDLDNPNGKVVITIKDLTDAGLIKYVVVDPKTNKKIPDDYKITATKKDDGTIEYTYDKNN